MEGTSFSFAKAIDDISGKIFIPASILAILAEFKDYLIKETGSSFFAPYIISIFFTGMLFGVTYFLLIEISVRFNSGKDISPLTGTCIMPIGFIGLFPEYINITLPITKVTGIAIITWSFVLINKKSEW